MVDQVKEIISEVFDIAISSVNENSALANFEEWDSLNHMELIVTIEKRFKIEMSFEEIVSIKSVGDLINIIKSKNH